MTIVGDIAQGIHAYRGLNEWSVLDEMYDEPPQCLDVIQNYRSTEEIVAFTNGVLDVAWDGKRQRGKPFARSGSEVVVSSCASFRVMVERAASSIKELVDAEMRNVAVILKDERTCREVARALQDEGIEAKVLTAKEQTYDGGLAVLTPAVAKGLEFSAVLVLGVDAKAYTQEDAHNGALLYVALTRALHHLHVMYVGEISP